MIDKFFQYRMLQLGLVNIPVGLICFGLTTLYLTNFKDMLPLICTSISCFLGVMNYYLILKNYPDITRNLIRLNIFIYWICLISVSIVYLLFINNLFKISNSFYSKWVYFVIGFQLIDGVEHFIFKVVNGKNKICIFNKKGSFDYSNCGGATLGLIRKVRKRLAN